MENNSIAKFIAKLALKIGAIKITGPKNPFTWAKGWKTPIYNDNRLHLGYPENYQPIAGALHALVTNNNKKVSGVLGTTSAGIPWGALLAQRLNKPFYSLIKGKPYLYGDLFTGPGKELEEKIKEADIIATNCPFGMPYGIVLADMYSKGFMFIRETKKAHGMQNQIEGPCKPGQKVLYLKTPGYLEDSLEDHIALLKEKELIISIDVIPYFDLKEWSIEFLDLIGVEDLISTGGSYLEEVEICRKNFARIEDVYAVFSYDFPLAMEKAEKSNVHINSLCNYTDLIDMGIEEGYIKPIDKEVLNEWRPNPEAWSDKYCGTTFTKVSA